MAVLIGATNGGYMVLVPPQSGATATVSALVNKDGSGNVAVPTEQYIQNSSGLYVPVSSANPLPAVLTGSLALLPSKRIANPFAVGTVVAPGTIASAITTGNSGYRQAAFSVSSVTGTSPTYHTTIKSLDSTGTVPYQTQSNANVTGSSSATSPLTFVTDKVIVQVDNSTGTNSITIGQSEVNLQ